MTEQTIWVTIDANEDSIAKDFKVLYKGRDLSARVTKITMVLLDPSDVKEKDVADAIVEIIQTRGE